MDIDDAEDDGNVRDLGHGHQLRLVGWSPDRGLNPQFAGIPDVARYGATISHTRPDNGQPHEGMVTFDGEIQRQLSPDQARWTVVSWEPLTLTPSVLCDCGDHGYITNGEWVPA